MVSWTREVHCRGNVRILDGCRPRWSLGRGGRRLGGGRRWM